MFKLKTLSLVMLLLLLQSCSSKPGKYNMVGVWESDCVTTGTLGSYKVKSVYAPDGSFEAQMITESASFNINFYSGTYKASRNKLQETITSIEGKSNLYGLPMTDESDLKWIDDRSVLINTDGDKCTTVRVANS